MTHLLDMIAVLIFLISCLIGGIRGLVREGTMLTAWFLGFVLSIQYAKTWGHWIQKQWNIQTMHDALAFGLILICVLMIGGLLGKGLRWLMNRCGLMVLDHVLGSLFGALRAILLITALIMIIRILGGETWIQSSMVLPYFAEPESMMQDFVKNRLHA